MSAEGISTFGTPALGTNCWPLLKFEAEFLGGSSESSRGNRRRFCKRAVFVVVLGGMSKIIAFFCQGGIAGKEFLEDISVQGKIFWWKPPFWTQPFANPRLLASIFQSKGHYKSSPLLRNKPQTRYRRRLKQSYCTSRGPCR